MIVKFAIDSQKGEGSEITGENAFACLGKKSLWNESEGGACDSITASGCFFSVIDGITGDKNASESVSGVIDQFQTLFNNTEDLKVLQTNDLKGLHEDGLKKSHELLLQLSEVSEQDTPMMVSMASLFVSRDEVIFSAEGNCRIYRFRDSVLELLSEDDTEAWELVEKGKASPDQLKTYPGYKKLTHAVGGKGQMKPSKQLQTEHVEMGDVFLLSSDGLNDVLSSDAIEGELNQSVGNGGEVSLVALDSLLSLVKSKNPKENLTVVLCQVFPKSSKWTSLIKAL